MANRSNVYLGKVSGGLSSASPTIAVLIPAWISILREKRKTISKKKVMGGDDIGGHCLKGQARKWVIGCRESRCTNRLLSSCQAFFSANLWTPRVFLKLTWRGMELDGWVTVDRSYRESRQILADNYDQKQWMANIKILLKYTCINHILVKLYMWIVNTAILLFILRTRFIFIFIF